MTSEYIISCVKKNAQGIIEKVGIDGEIFDVKTISEKILKRENAYYTIVMGIRLRVFVLRDPITNEPYLTTTTNKKLPNNLNFLPKCK
ncbi:MAG: DUF3892 domain-containing protein [Candidatus Nitrosocosmicus sp.]|jgi:hypothetical protein|uniref:DUF3892 domain-containing protein n=1 Tax=Candidatus Nitrosocosmicus sp. FF01 TaxID=3397670 RepID=UPI002A6EBD1F|nr:hypothetical protein [Candidatus Nitrosocosmicus sp.]GKS62151.1 hypothetical protein YTPLAS21_16090 [Candidatus Nitrosocosmicus sp.]